METMNETAKRMLKSISPIYENAHNFRAILSAIGAGTERVTTLISSLGEEAFPQNAVLLLALWEMEYALAGKGSEQARRAALLARLTEQGRADPCAIARICSAAAQCPCEVLENTGEGEFTVRAATCLPDASAIRAALGGVLPAHLTCRVTGRGRAAASQGLAVHARFGGRIIWKEEEYGT